MDAVPGPSSEDRRELERDTNEVHTDTENNLSETFPDVNEKKQGANSFSEPTAVIATDNLPSLRGFLRQESTCTSCKGLWAMSDSGHEQPGQTSDFEFKLVTPTSDDLTFPVEGRYQGWFNIKQLAPAKNVKVDDREMDIQFEPIGAEEGAYNVRGQGVNIFGTFTLRGKLSKSGAIQLYREYTVINPNPVISNRRRSSGVVPKDRKKNGIKNEPEPDTDVIDISEASPRNGGGRVRKQSTTVQKNFAEAKVKGPSARASFGSSDKSAAKSLLPMVPPVNIMRQDSTDSVMSTSNRAQRLNRNLKRCSDLLRELMKHPLGVWFLEPVDHIKLNIPDYPKIIKEPMDFRTIRDGIERQKYEAPEHFAEHMRLVFRNALTFNQLKDNPVNIAARELSAKFEDKYRAITAQAAYSMPDYVALERTMSSSSLKGISGKGKKSVGGKAPSSSGGAGRKSLSSGGIGLGPRSNSMYSFSAPPPVDPNNQQIAQLLRKMDDMQSEIVKLRTVVGQNEILQKVQESREASHNPLSFQEKSDLISQIHKLEPTHMDEVIKIVQSAYPSALQDSEEFEVPLDELDTLTLRKLQRYIDNAVGSKKRRPGSVNMNISHQSSSTMVTGESNKKPRRASQSEGYNVIPTDSITIMSHTTSVEVRASISGEQDEEHMLFSAEELLDSHAPKGPQIENDDIENFSDMEMDVNESMDM